MRASGVLTLTLSIGLATLIAHSLPGRRTRGATMAARQIRCSIRTETDHEKQCRAAAARMVLPGSRPHRLLQLQSAGRRQHDVRPRAEEQHHRARCGDWHRHVDACTGRWQPGCPGDQLLGKRRSIGSTPDFRRRRNAARDRRAHSNVITSFGDNGRVNMRVGDLPARRSGTAGACVRTPVSTGSVPGERTARRLAISRVRRHHWKAGLDFHTIPHPGEFGYDTWPEGATSGPGGVNSWGEISIDKARGIALPAWLADARQLTAAIVPATISSATRSSRSMRAPANACGTSRRCITTHGTTT